MLATHYWEWAGKGEGGPHQDAHSDDVLAGVAVAKVTKEWGEKHVAHNEGSLQEAPKTIANVSLRMAIDVKPITCLVLYLCENTCIILCQQTMGIRMLRVSYTRKCGVKCDILIITMRMSHFTHISSILCVLFGDHTSQAVTSLNLKGFIQTIITCFFFLGGGGGASPHPPPTGGNPDVNPAPLR